MPRLVGWGGDSPHSSPLLDKDPVHMMQEVEQPRSRDLQEIPLQSIGLCHSVVA